MPNSPTIGCCVTFLLESEGGRSAFPNGAFSDGQYRPHLVVGNSQQREAIIDANNVTQEKYLGVAFVKGPEVIEFGKPLLVQLALIYYPVEGHGRLVSGETFTIREGNQIVGYGIVN